jgi:hypothetical protein
MVNQSISAVDKLDKNKNNGSNIDSYTRPALPLLILLPSLPPTLLISPIVPDIQLGSPIHRDMTERNYLSKEHVSDEYLQNSKIANEMQSFNEDVVKPISKDLKLSNKLFDQHESNNILYLEQGKNDKKEQMPQQENRFKCFYCNLMHRSNIERIEHIENEHPGKLYYPTPRGFSGSSE